MERNSEELEISVKDFLNENPLVKICHEANFLLVGFLGGCFILAKQAEVHCCRQHVLRVHAVRAPQASKAHKEEVKEGAGQSQLQALLCLLGDTG